MEKETYECHDCGRPFVRTVLNLGVVFACTRCESCIRKFNERTLEMRAADSVVVKDAFWLKVCPSLYRDTDQAHPGLHPMALEAVRRYEPRAGRGLGLIGETGGGKTRCAFLALHKAHIAGLRVNAVSHKLFGKIAAKAAAGTTEEKAKADSAMESFERADVLLLDDLGKAPSTERADSDLEDLIEIRTSNKRAILWTANGSGEWLISRLGPDRGEPTIRRLTEFCEIVSLEGGAR
jgi:DNA replication protein DnaC